MSEQQVEKRGHHKTRTGLVVSDKMDKTIVVEIERLVRHPLYKKYVKRRVKCKAHDERNEARVGCTVVIEECRPMSRDKRWRLVEITHTPTAASEALAAVEA